MPNWCLNTLSVTGDSKQLMAFKRKAALGENDFCIKTFFPMPEELEGTTSPAPRPNKELRKKYGYDNWYDWCNANWGTKWDVEGHLEKTPRGSVGYTFDSAWAPPDEAIKKISELYPKLTFTLEYDEPGMDFAGTMVIEKGEVVSDLKTKSKLNAEMNEG